MTAKTLFDPVKLGGIDAKNRVIRSATAEMKNDGEGRITDGYIPVFENLAKGGVGVIITGMFAVDENAGFGRMTPNTYNDTFVRDFHKLADMVHGYGCRIVAQLVHSGAKAQVPGEDSRPLAPSDITLPSAKPARAMTRQEIADVVVSFAKAAARCKEAGADGVQIHGAHGYLISQFLSPSTNKRTDEYGGDIANRGRILLEMLDTIRKEVGADYPVWIKINCKDLVEESITLAECIWICKEMEKHGLDAIELSAGMGYNRDSSPSKRIADESEEGSFALEALALAEEVGIPVISTGGYRTPAVIETWLNKGKIAAIGLSRPLICEPDLAGRWQSGDSEKARCISCSRCYSPKAGIGCQAFPAEG